MIFFQDESSSTFKYNSERELLSLAKIFTYVLFNKCKKCFKEKLNTYFPDKLYTKCLLYISSKQNTTTSK